MGSRRGVGPRQQPYVSVFCRQRRAIRKTERLLVHVVPH